MENKKFFKFEKIGDEIEGIFNGFYENEYGLAIKIDDTLVSINKVALKNVIKSAYKLFEESKTKIKITYIGNSNKKYGANKVKLFEVYVDGILIKKEPIKLDTKEDISKFF
jgi:hypothetical protein